MLNFAIYKIFVINDELRNRWTDH